MQLFNIPKNPRVLIFDIDATLYTCPEYAHEQIDAQIRHFAKINGLSADGARNMVADFRRKWAAEHGGKKISLGNLLVFFGIPIEESIEWRKMLFDPADYLSHDEKLVCAVKKLKESFYLLCVTNNPVEPARKTLEVLGVSEFFPKIVGLDTCLASKPSKKILEKAIEWAKIDTGEKIDFCDCVSIGDRFDIDLDLALSLGMGGVLVKGAEDVYDLPAVLQS